MPERPIMRVSLVSQAAELAGRAVGAFAGGIQRGKLDVAVRAKEFLDQGRAFAPGVPLEAQQPEGALPRIFEVRTGRNLAYNPRREDNRLTPFATLRQLADSHSVTRDVIQSIKNSHMGMVWDVAPREEFKELAESKAGELQAAKDLLRRPDRNMSWRAWLSALIEDVLVIDAATLVPRFDLAGRPLALQLIDGATIKPLVDVLGQAPLPPAPAFQQILYGRPETEFSTDELMYRPKNRRAWTPYGQSPIEMVAITINLALRRELHYLNFYTTGNLPDAIYMVPEKWTDSQIMRFQQWFDDTCSGNSAQRSGTVRFLPGGQGSGYQGTKDEVWNYEFDEWLARVVVWAFGLSPLPIAKMVNRASAEQMDRRHQSDGIEPVRAFIKDLLDEYLQVWCKAPWMEFRWIDERPEDARLLLDEDKALVAIGARTLDEVRVARGLDPLEGGLGERPFVMTTSGPVLLEDALSPGLPAAALPGSPLRAPGSPRPAGQGTFVAEGRELQQWRRVALKDLRKGVPPRPFRAQALGEELRAAVSRGLAQAKTEADVREVFAAVRLHKAGPATRRYRAQRGLLRALKAAFKVAAPGAKTAALEALRRRRPAVLTKADTGDDEVWENLAREVEAFLAEAAGAGAEAAMGVMGLDFEAAPAVAVEQARARAAELVGKTWVGDELVDNPRPGMAITETIRADVNRLTEKAVAEGWGTQQLAEQVEAVFGDSRAETIARTETAMAYNRGAAEAYRDEGVHKVAVLDGIGCLPEGHDDGAPEADDADGVQPDAQADGQRWSVDEYAGLPVGHPNCVRSAAPIVELHGSKDEEEEEA